MKLDQEAAFEVLVHEHATDLLRTGWLLVGDRTQAEDLLQATFERTARHWARLEGDPLTYTRKVLARLALDRRRRRIRPGHVIDLRHDWIPELSDRTPLQRAVLVLRCFDDLPDLEVAAALGVSRDLVAGVASDDALREAMVRATADIHADADVTWRGVEAAFKGGLRTWL